MISQTKLAEFRARLSDELKTLGTQSEQTSDARSVVELDQQSIGRLSRMDALQNQAMALATDQARRTRRTAIAQALARIEDGEFGSCAECGEEIATKRLDRDPTYSTCITCAAG